MIACQISMWKRSPWKRDNKLPRNECNEARVDATIKERRRLQTRRTVIKIVPFLCHRCALIRCSTHSLESNRHIQTPYLWLTALSSLPFHHTIRITRPLMDSRDILTIKTIINDPQLLPNGTQMGMPSSTYQGRRRSAYSASTAWPWLTSVNISMTTENCAQERRA